MKPFITSELFWEFSKDSATLKSKDEVIIELKDEKASKASFNLDGKNYLIKNIGFWKAKTIVECNGEIVLSLNRSFLGSKGTIDFTNRAKYECKIHNTPLVTLTFTTAEGQKVVSYRLDTSSKPKTTMEINPGIEMSIDLLMLIILGCFTFKGVTIENTEADFITLVAGA